MKSQDIFILLKLVSLQNQLKQGNEPGNLLPETGPNAWVGWTLNESPQKFKMQQTVATDVYSNRALEASTGVSKSEVNASIRRSIAVGLVKRDGRTNQPQVNITGLLEFIVHGIKYVYPATPSALRRGIPTSLAAPSIKGKVPAESDDTYIWPDALGKEKGQAVAPLYKTVPRAVRKDQRLYGYLALVDAIRLGQGRETTLAAKELNQQLRGANG